MRMRRGIFRFLLLATLGWVGFVAYTAYGTVPQARLPTTNTQLADYCRFSFRATSDMGVAIVRYTAVAQYHQARTSTRNPACRAYHQLSDAQVADIAARNFVQWLSGQQRAVQREHAARRQEWIWNYLLRALAPPFLVWLFVLAVSALVGGARREEA